MSGVSLSLMDLVKRAANGGSTFVAPLSFTGARPRFCSHRRLGVPHYGAKRRENRLGQRERDIACLRPFRLSAAVAKRLRLQEPTVILEVRQAGRRLC